MIMILDCVESASVSGLVAIAIQKVLALALAHRANEDTNSASCKSAAETCETECSQCYSESDCWSSNAGCGFKDSTCKTVSELRATAAPHTAATISCAQQRDAKFLM